MMAVGETERFIADIVSHARRRHLGHPEGCHLNSFHIISAGLNIRYRTASWLPMSPVGWSLQRNRAILNARNAVRLAAKTPLSPPLPDRRRHAGRRRPGRGWAACRPG